MGPARESEASYPKCDPCNYPPPHSSSQRMCVEIPAALRAVHNRRNRAGERSSLRGSISFVWGFDVDPAQFWRRFRWPRLRSCATLGTTAYQLPGTVARDGQGFSDRGWH